MADTKISQLTSATTPLAGTELVPVVQGATTKKVAASALGAQAVATHEAAADPHPQYLTATEGNAAYATAAQGAKADTAVQPAGLSGYVQTSDARLSDQRTPTDGSVTDAKIVAGGLAAGSINWVAIQAWAPSTAYAKGDLVEYLGIAYRRTVAGTSGASFVTANWQQSTSSAPPSHTQAASTITGLATVATSGAYGDLSGRPTLGGAASLSVGTTAGTVAAGDDSRLSDSREWSASTISQAETEAGTATTRRAFTAQRVFQAAAAWWVGYRSTVGNALATAASAAAARTTLGLGGSATLGVGTTAGTVAAGDDARITGALGAATAATTYQPLDSDLTAIAALTTTTFGLALLTQADAAATRTTIGAGTSSVIVSGATPAALGATAAVGTSADAARADHVHARSTYADLGAIGDGLILVVSNKGETATAGTNYAEVPVPVPSGSFTLTAVRFGCHIDNTGSSSSTFNAYKRTSGGTKTSVLTGNATLGSAASLVDASATITGGTFSAGDRVGVDLVGVGTGVSGLFAQFIFTRSAT